MEKGIRNMPVWERDLKKIRFSDFLKIKETGVKVIKYGPNMDKTSIASKDMLDGGIGIDNPSLNTVSTHVNQFRLSSDFQNSLKPFGALNKYWPLIG